MKEARIFDIDGTLLESFETDCELFVRAVKEVLGIDVVNSDWSSYRHVTDEGILRDIIEDNGFGRDSELFESTKRHFISLLSDHIRANGPFAEIPGAVDFVSGLIEGGRHYVAYATGAWRESALLKLESAGFPISNIRVSTSSEFEDRVSIMRGALIDAPPTIQRITYYGDGAWDQAAVHELGWEFVPVGAALDGLRQYHGVAVR